MYDKPPGWDVKKISDKTHKKLTKVWKHRETGGWKSQAGKDYRKYLKDLKKVTTKVKVPIKSNTDFFYPTSTAMLNNFIYAAYTDGTLIKFDLNGSIIWQIELNDILKTPIKILNGAKN